MRNVETLHLLTAARPSSNIEFIYLGHDALCFMFITQHYKIMCNLAYNIGDVLAHVVTLQLRVFVSKLCVRRSESRVQCVRTHFD